MQCVCAQRFHGWRVKAAWGVQRPSRQGSKEAADRWSVGQLAEWRSARNGARAAELRSIWPTARATAGSAPKRLVAWPNSWLRGLLHTELIVGGLGQ